MILLKEVTKVYEIGDNRVFALNDVNLEVETGGFLAIVGPSGSGKSTLLYTIGGLLTPTKGDVVINGVSIYRLTSKERAKFRRENVGFIFQTFELIPYLTALENVMLPLFLAGVSSDEQQRRARDVLDKVGLAKKAFHKAIELSVGEQQRVAVARGIVNNPAILLADEPTGSLDQKTGSEIMQILRELHEIDRLTIIIVTHNLRLAKLTDRIVEIIDGRVILDRYLNEGGRMFEI
ncbi:ABC transporter ATP-binding protein [Candidatus Bathyarchaeota archaeon]|nr:ABC transporter ATP-binding protein [Candidatus Bathyarchaeota archaeon]MBS7618222.1 ABC transporter ATP-binding protein [Candidatus Bathyarchaeota archaeon]